MHLTGTFLTGGAEAKTILGDLTAASAPPYSWSWARLLPLRFQTCRRRGRQQTAAGV